MIRAFLYSWLAYWGLVALLPAHSLYPAVEAAFLLQATFVLLVMGGYFLASPGWREIRMPTAAQGEIVSARVLLRLALMASLAGFLMLVYDKVFVQHIDYSQGIAVARQRWQDLGEAREGHVSSIWSVLGYAFGSAYYVAAILAVTQSAVLTARERLAALGGTFLFALANSALIGGRSNFMLIAVVVIGALSARSDLRLGSVLTSARQRRIGAALLIASGVYIVYVFLARASAGDDLAMEYAAKFLPYEGLDFDDWYVRWAENGWFGAASHMTILVLVYLTHSFATVAAIMDAPHEDKVIIFNNVSDILYKLGAIPRSDTDWFLAGRFPSVPGALWHEFGALGFAVGALLLGMAASLTSRWAAAYPRHLLPLGAYSLVGATMILTPYVFAPDFLSFPMVMVALIVLAMVSRVRLRAPAPPVERTQEARDG